MKQIASSFATALLAMTAVAASASLPPGDESSYGYLRTVEGPGRVVQASSGAPIELEPNYPVLAGDLVEVDPGGRVELSLPDFNIVRLDGGSELKLARLALSAETQDTETALRLLRGEMQIVVRDLLVVAERPRVDTANTTIYLQGSGNYRIATDGYGWTEVVVRRGFAEIATEAGSSVVRSGEQAWVEGGRWPRVAIERAGGPDDLERWGAHLDGELTGYGEAPVEDHLAYSAAPLDRHGSWVTEDGYRAWRPAVAASWRPYEAGYWADTPTGMVWVSSEPWAWVTYHYGSWMPSPRWGWVWRPGIQFAPAWVYWYWGPRYVAWVPVGYYSGHYGYYGRGFRFGIHGWAGGHWGLFADWTFCSTRSYRRRDLHHHVRRGHHLARDTRSFTLERGLISTDSRPEARRRAARRTRPGEESLPDVTAFVGRQRALSREVTERVFSDRRVASHKEVWDRPERVRANAARSRTAATRGDSREAPDAWRRESGRLRPGDTPAEPRAAGPRARAVTPSERGTDGSSWGRDRTSRAAPRGRTGPEGSRSLGDRSGEARGRDDQRPPVVRRVWEGIRDRQRALPSAPRATNPGPSSRRPSANRPGPTPDRRPQATQPRSAPSRRPQATQPRPAPERRPQASQPRSAPERRPQATQPRSQPSRRAPSAERRSEPPRRSSATHQSSPSRRQPSARSGDRGSSRRSSAGPSRGSSQGSSRSRAARRRPPDGA